MSASRRSASKEVRNNGKVLKTISLKQQQARTTATLAYIFSVLLLLMFLLNFAAVAFLSRSLGAKDSLEALARVFSTWIPIIIAYVASVVAFYFPHSRR
jgi:uncharacterized membrane protein